MKREASATTMVHLYVLGEKTVSERGGNTCRVFGRPFDELTSQLACVWVACDLERPNFLTIVLSGTATGCWLAGRWVASALCAVCSVLYTV